MDYSGLRKGFTIYLPLFQEARCCLPATVTPAKAMAN